MLRPPLPAFCESGGLTIPWSSRFVAIPVPTLQDKLGSQIKGIETEVDSLGKRLHYLETTAKNSQDHIEKMLRGAGQQ